jgi:hypothetical protein
LSTRTTISVFKSSCNMGEVMVCAFPVVSCWSLINNEKQAKVNVSTRMI